MKDNQYDCQDNSNAMRTQITTDKDKDICDSSVYSNLMDVSGLPNFLDFPVELMFMILDYLNVEDYTSKNSLAIYHLARSSRLNFRIAVEWSSFVAGEYISKITTLLN